MNVKVNERRFGHGKGQSSPASGPHPTGQATNGSDLPVWPFSTPTATGPRRTEAHP